MAFCLAYLYPQINASLFCKILNHGPHPENNRRKRVKCAHLKSISQVFQTMAVVPRGGTNKEILLLYYWGKRCLCLVTLKPSTVNKDVFAPICAPCFQRDWDWCCIKGWLYRQSPKSLVIEKSWVYCWNEDNIRTTVVMVSRWGTTGRCIDGVWMSSPKSFRKRLDFSKAW